MKMITHLIDATKTEHSLQLYDESTVATGKSDSPLISLRY